VYIQKEVFKYVLFIWTAIHLDFCCCLFINMSSDPLQFIAENKEENNLNNAMMTDEVMKIFVNKMLIT